MDNDVTIVVDAKNRSVQAFGEATKGAKTVGDAAVIAGRQVKDMGDKLDAANAKARKLAEAEERAAEKARRMAEDLALMRRELAQSGDSSGTLSRKIDRLTTDTRYAAMATEEYRHAANRASAEAREQARAYDRVADNARQAARAVAFLGASSKLGGGKGGGFGSGSDISAGFFKGGIGGATSALEGSLGTPVIGPALLAAIAAAAIPTAALAGGAVGGAVGLGGAAAGAGAGLAGAWMGDPAKFSSMWNAAIDGVQHRWLSSSKAFSDELTGGLKEADRVLRDLPVEKALALSQSFVTPLAQGAGGGATNVANGLVDALERAQPIVDRIGPKLANLGNSVGDTFRMISEGSEGGADALGDLADGIGYVVRATGLLILGFENAYQSIHDFESANQDFISSVPIVGSFADGLADSLFGIHESSIVAGRSLEEADRVSGGLVESWTDMARAGAEATLETLGLNDALTQTRNTMLSMADADLAVAQGWLDLKEGLDDGKKSLDAATQAGLDNQKAILTQVELLERQRQQAIETGGGTAEAVEQANAAYNASIEKLKQAAIAAGFNATQVDILLASLGALPANTTANVTVNGLPTALAQGISLGNALNRIDGQTYESNVYVYYHQKGQALNAPQAYGGPTSAGMSEVNDWGGAGTGELIRTPNGSTVIPAGTGRQMMRDLASGGGHRSETVVRFVGDDSALWSLIQRALREGALTVPANAVVGAIR